ncbi:MAG: hypothetical protein JNL83_37100 [Myxococcales bacterium]|nr:hypothetical protein [Myxococcales bacterium]
MTNGLHAPGPRVTRPARFCSGWFVAIAGIASACSDTRPTCDELERHVAGIAATEDRRTREASDALRATLGQRHGESGFLPRVGELGREIGAQCRDGALSAETITCLHQAKRGIDLDRCCGTDPAHCDAM